MRALTSGELGGLRSAQEALLDKTCALYHTSRVSDGQGGYTDTDTADDGNPYDCAVGPAKSLGDYELAGSLQGRTLCEVRMARDTPVTSGDYLVIDSARYDIVGICRRSRRIVLRLLCITS